MISSRNLFNPPSLIVVPKDERMKNVESLYRNTDQYLSIQTKEPQSEGVHS